MLGGHLDSWHSATGATDNAIGSTMMLEAARHDSGAGVEAAAHHPRGSVVGRRRGIAGLGGLREAALRHVRRSEAGIRQARLLFQHRLRHRPCSRRQHLRTAGSRRVSSPRPCEPFKDWAAGAANATTSRATGGTDSTNFNAAGLPGIGLQQDPIEYQSFTWHTQLDTYERIVPEDVKQAATEIASMVWTVANLDHMIPRVPKDQMPAPAARGGR